MNIELVKTIARDDLNPAAIGAVIPTPADAAVATSAGCVSTARVTTWAKRVLAGNPAYILSAGLLLYGIYLVSGDARFLSLETLKLVFNFSALQGYELMLVATAIFLARRQIWYDSTLLVFLENLLVCVPFILVSQAIFIGPSYVWTICVLGGLLAAARFASLKGFIRELNFPRPLITLGILFLTLHLFSPIVLRSIYQEGDPRTSEPVFQSVLTNCWLWLMPALAGLAYLLPKKQRDGQYAPQRCWLPTTLLGLWVTATGVHLSAIGYVYSIKWQWLFLAPVLWAAAWSAYLRRTDFVRSSNKTNQQILLVLPAIATVFALGQMTHPAFIVLSLLNTLAFFALWARERNNELVLELGICSLLAGLVGAFSLGVRPGTYYDSTITWRAGLIIFSIVQGLLFRDSRVALVGALGVTVAVAYAAHAWSWSGHWAIQAGLIFFLLHSQTWREPRGDGAKFFCVAAALAWLMDLWVWMADRGSSAAWQGAVIAMLLLAAYGAAWLILGYWGPRIIPWIAAIALASTLVYGAAALIQATPGGLLALAGSFLLFGIGTGLALTKHRWNRQNSTTGPVDG